MYIFQGIAKTSLMFWLILWEVLERYNHDNHENKKKDASQKSGKNDKETENLAGG